MRFLFAAVMSWLALSLSASPAQADTWHEAQTTHFSIVSAGDEKDLRKFAERLEYFHNLLRLATGISEEGHPVVRVRVFLVSSIGDVKRLFGAPGSDVAGFYSPREDGAIAVVPRTTGDGTFTGQLVLFHEYSHHYMLQYTPAAYPSWYVEGFAEIASTASFERKGAITFGKAASHRQYELDAGLSYPVVNMVNGTYLQDRAKGRGWSYGDAWVLTHYLTFSDERRGQLRAYLNAINGGKKMPEAAQVFGDLGGLQHDVSVYLAGRSFPYRAVPIGESWAGPITMRELGGAESAIIEMQIEFERKISLPDREDLDHASKTGALSDAEFAEKLTEAKNARNEWIVRIEAIAARFPNESAGWLLLADARCATEDYAACAAAASRADAFDPGNERAMVRHAEAMIGLAKSMSPIEGKNRIVAAQKILFKANAVQPNDPLALLWLYRSYGAMGQRADADGLAALLSVVELIPQEDGPRLTLAQELVQRGRLRDARIILRPLAYSPHESPASRKAREILDQIEATIG